MSAGAYQQEVVLLNSHRVVNIGNLSSLKPFDMPLGHLFAIARDDMPGVKRLRVNSRSTRGAQC